MFFWNWNHCLGDESVLPKNINVYSYKLTKPYIESWKCSDEQLKLMIDSIRNADTAKGNSIKQVLDIELELQKFATRSLQATKNISKGDILSEGENFDILRQIEILSLHGGAQIFLLKKCHFHNDF